MKRSFLIAASFILMLFSVLFSFACRGVMATSGSGKPTDFVFVDAPKNGKEITGPLVLKKGEATKVYVQPVPKSASNCKYTVQVFADGEGESAENFVYSEQNKTITGNKYSAKARVKAVFEADPPVESTKPLQIVVEDAVPQEDEVPLTPSEGTNEFVIPIPQGQSIDTAVPRTVTPEGYGHFDPENPSKFIINDTLPDSEDDIPDGTLITVETTLADGSIIVNNIIKGGLVAATSITVDADNFHVLPGQAVEIPLIFDSQTCTYHESKYVTFQSSDETVVSIVNGKAVLAENAPFGATATISGTSRDGVNLTPYTITNNNYTPNTNTDAQTEGMDVIYLPSSYLPLAEGYEPVIKPEGSVTINKATGEIELNPNTPDGTAITITIKKKGANEPETFTIVKNRVIPLQGISATNLKIGSGKSKAVQVTFDPSNATYKSYKIVIANNGDANNIINTASSTLNTEIPEGSQATITLNENLEQGEATLEIVSIKYPTIKKTFTVEVKNELENSISISSAYPLTLATANNTKNWDENGIIEYSFDNQTWQTNSQPNIWDGVNPIVNDNQKTSGLDDNGAERYYIYLRGTGNTKISGNSTDYRWVITNTDNTATGNDVILNGSMKNLLDYQEAVKVDDITMADNCFRYIFYGCAKLKELGDDFELPMNVLSSYCYNSMFNNCSSLTSLPSGFTLPAETLANYCYNSMFYNCTSLTSLPSNFTLPAQTLANYCYCAMFSDCSSLTSLPSNFTLPAETLVSRCYYNMFKGCSSLTSLPSSFTLPAKTLADSCYYAMFYNCSSLTSLPSGFTLPAKTLQASCYATMFNGCSALKIQEFDSEPGDGYILQIPSSIPSGSVTGMFAGCNSAGFTGTPTAGKYYR